jgi:hypothetical protein
MNRPSKLAAVMGMAAVLFGCATAAQRQYQAIAVNTRSVGAEMKACVMAVYNAPEAAPLRPHVAIDPRDITLAQLADTSLANPEEISYILVLYPRLQQCQKQMLDGLMRGTPSLVPILATEYVKGEDNTLALIQQKETWGDFSKRRRDNAIATIAALQAEGQRITQGLEQAQEAELERRAAAMNAFAQAAQSWAAQVQQSQPVITNCRQWGYQGSQLTCMTY